MIKIVFKDRCKNALNLFCFHMVVSTDASYQSVKDYFFSATSGDLKRQDHRDGEAVCELSLFSMAFDWPYSEIIINSIT